MWSAGWVEMTAAYLLTIVFVKVSVLLFVSFLALAPGASFAAAQPPAVPASPSSTAELERHRSGESTTEAPEMFVQVEQLTTAAVRLPMAAILACVLAVRPRRRGTPERQAPVIQTQIILAIVGAVVELGEKLRVDTPNTKSVYERVKLLESTRKA